MDTSDELHFRSTIGLARDLTDRLYGTLARKVREAVSNAVDAGATDIWLDFQCDSLTRKWSARFLDNGVGMTLEKVRNQFLQLGASEKRHDPSKIGRIGIGVLALTLGTQVELATRATNGTEVEAHLDLSPLFDPNQAHLPLEELGLGRPANRVANPPDKLGTFTRLYIPELRPELEYELVDWSGFRSELQQVLPLRPHPSDPFIKYLVRTGKDELAKALGAVSPSINVWLNGDRLFRPLFDMSVGEPVDIQEIRFQVQGSQENWMTVWGYLVDAGRKISRPGISLRLKNMLLETSWLGIAQGNAIARTWASGELFLDQNFDDDKGLNLDRSGLMPRHQQVEDIMRRLTPIVTTFLGAIAERRPTRQRKGSISNAPSSVSALTSALRKQVGVLREQLTAEGSLKSEGIYSLLEALGYDTETDIAHDRTEIADMVVMGMDRRPVFPILIDKPVAALTTAMDAIGTTVGVRVRGLEWEVWRGVGPAKRAAASVRLDRASASAAAGVLFLSKKHRWSEEAVSLTAQGIGEVTSQPVTVALFTGSVDFDYMMGLLRDAGASLVPGDGGCAFSLEVSSSNESPWVKTEAQTTVLRGRFDRIQDIPNPVWALSLPDSSVAQALTWQLLSGAPDRIGLVPVMTHLARGLRWSGNQYRVLGLTVDRGQGRIDTTVFRTPQSAVDLDELVSASSVPLALRLAMTDRQFVTVFSNHFMTLMASSPEEIPSWTQHLLKMVGVLS